MEDALFIAFVSL